MVGMGDIEQEGKIGIVCLNCDTHWEDRAAFDRGEAAPDVGSEAPSVGDEDGGGE
jgi:hypothetical protein